MNNILDEIKSFGYDVKKETLLYVAGNSHYNSLKIVTPDGNEKGISGDIYIKTDQNVKKPSSTEEANKLIQEGKYIKISADEVYKEYYSMNDDEFYTYKNGYTKKTGEYFEQLKKEIGLIDHEICADSSGAELEEFDTIIKYNLFLNTGDITVGKLGENKYIAQYSYQTSVDDFSIEKIYFNKLPNEMDIRAAVNLEDFKAKLLLSRITEFFECKKCLKTLHWTDIPGEFETKIEFLETNYCGC